MSVECCVLLLCHCMQFLDAQESQDEMIVRNKQTHKPKPNISDLSDLTDLTALTTLPDLPH